MKRCNDCREELELTFFGKDKSRYDGLDVRCKPCKKAHNKAYNALTLSKEKLRIRQNNYNKNPKNKLASNMRSRLYQVLKGRSKSKHTFEIIGCSVDFLRNHLEEQFKEGMTWDNYGEWHVDHIIPLSSAPDLDFLYELCHYKNLQPLWAVENLSKGKKLV